MTILFAMILTCALFVLAAVIISGDHIYEVNHKPGVTGIIAKSKSESVRRPCEVAAKLPAIPFGKLKHEIPLGKLKGLLK